MRIGCAIGFLLAIVMAAPAVARGLTIDDLLRLQDYTQVVLDPATQTTVVGRTRPYENGVGYRYDWFNRRMLSELWIHDQQRGGRLRLFLGGRRDAGYWASSLAPSGRRLVVFRLAGDRLSVGIADLARRSVRWLPLRPDLPYISPNPTWLDDDRLMIVERPDGSLPHQLGFGFAPARRDPARWTATASGQVASISVLGSGRSLGRLPRAAPRQLTIHDLRAGSSRVVVRGEIVDVAVSPDRRRAAVLLAGADLPMRPDTVVDPADLTREHQLDIVDLQTGEGAPACGNCDVLPNLLAWSPSGRQLLFYARNPGNSWERGHLMTIGGSPALPTVVPLIDRSVTGVISVHADWHGEAPTVWGRPAQQPAAQPDWIGPAGPLTGGRAKAPSDLLAMGQNGVVFMGGGGLWHSRSGATARRFDVAGQASPAVAPLDPLLAGTRALLNPQRNRSVVLTVDGGTRQLVIAHDSGRVQRPAIALGEGQRVLAATGSGDAAVIVYRPAQRGAALEWSTAGRQTNVIDRINGHLDRVEARDALMIAEPRIGEITRHHRLYLPADESKTAPLVVIPYPGLVWGDRAPRPDIAAADMTTNVQLLVARGYAVLEPSLPNPDSKADMLDAITSDIARAIDTADRTGRIDRSRIAVFGHSYGGYAALAMATRGDIVRTVIAAAAPINLAATYGFIDPRAKEQVDGISTTIAFGWFEGGQGQLGLPPWRIPQRYVEASPLFRAGQFNVPVLLLHGEFDYLPVGGAEQMVMALYRQNKDVELVRYAAEGHMIRSPANVRDYWRRVFAALDGMSPKAHPAATQ